MDTTAIAACLPGCKELRPLGDDRYAAELVVGVAAITGSYAATVTLAEKLAPQSYRLLVEANGRTGFVKGDALITLIAVGRRHGRSRSPRRADAGGLLARVGQRMMEGVARMSMDKFFACLAARTRTLRCRVTRVLSSSFSVLALRASQLGEVRVARRAGAENPPDRDAEHQHHRDEDEVRRRRDADLHSAALPIDRRQLPFHFFQTPADRPDVPEQARARRTRRPRRRSVKAGICSLGGTSDSGTNSPWAGGGCAGCAARKRGQRQKGRAHDRSHNTHHRSSSLR